MVKVKALRKMFEGSRPIPAGEVFLTTEQRAVELGDLVEVVGKPDKADEPEVVTADITEPPADKMLTPDQGKTKARKPARRRTRRS